MNKTSLVVTVIVIIIVATAVVIYLTTGRQAIETPVGTPIEEATLGSSLYEKATNPVKDQLPETVAPVPNPLEGVYQNPFE